MRRLALAVVLAVAGGVAAPSQAATLRTGTILQDDVVRLSDLFDGVEKDRVIGPAPEPGGRIFVEAAQLNAIARQFQVDWRSAALSDTIVLERPGRPFPRDAAMAALRSALDTAGVSADADVEVPGYSPPMLPAGLVARPEVGQLDYDGATGRFTAVLSLTAPDMQPIHSRLSGRVQEMVNVPVASRRLLPGDVVGLADVKMGRLRVEAVRAEIARDAAQAVGMAVRHPIGSGTPFGLADLGRPLAVQRGDAVHMQLEFPGLLVSAQGVALESGSVGDRIKVLNTSSRAVLEAEVTAAGLVRITGSAPLQLSSNTALPIKVAGR